MSNKSTAGLSRRVARLVGLSVPIIALSALSVGTASATEVQALSPTQPIDAFSDHWQKYHKGKDITQEPGVILSDPQGYMAIHQELFMDMIGQGH